jgi:hypothetical protein
MEVKSTPVPGSAVGTSDLTVGVTRHSRTNRIAFPLLLSCFPEKTMARAEISS